MWAFDPWVTSNFAFLIQKIMRHREEEYRYYKNLGARNSSHENEGDNV